MPDRGNQQNKGEPRAQGELEAQEERRRKQEEEVRREQEHRAEGAPAQAVEDDISGADINWNPPAEMAMMEPGRKAWWRVIAFLIILFVGWFVIRWTTQFIFAPRLALLGAVIPTETVSPDDPVTVGVFARNETRNEGAAYALLVFADGSEIEGPVVVVPGRDSVLVPVQVTFPPGDHVATLVLYDAWRENTIVGSTHGLLIRSGTPEVHVVEASVSRGADNSIAVDVGLSNRTRRDEAVTPVVVFTPETGTAAPIEIELPAVTVPAGQTLSAPLRIPASSLPAGRYVVAVVVVTFSGERLGEGAHGILFVHAPEE